MENSSPLLSSQVGGSGGGGRVGEPPAPEGVWTGDRVKSIVYAGLDAILTSFSLISSISANHLSSGDVLVLGFSNLIADGISMGFGDFVSSSTERDMAEKAHVDMERAVRRHIRPQLSELLDTYQALGMSLEDATTVVSVFAKYKNILLEEKMTTQKGMLPPRQIEQPWKTGLITFLSFLAFGCAPLVSFIVLIPFTGDYSVKFLFACLLSGLALVLLGAARAKISGQKYGYAVMVTLFNGCFAAASAYLVSWGLRKVAGGIHE